MGESVEISDENTVVRLHSATAPYVAEIRQGIRSGRLKSVFGDDDSYEDPFRDFVVDLEAPGLTASTHVRNYEENEGHGLGAFFDGLVAALKAWEGERRWEATEHTLAIDATHDSVRSVTLRFILQESTPDGFLAHLYDDVEAWKVEASVAVAAGERLVRLAEEIHEFFSYERIRGST